MTLLISSAVNLLHILIRSFNSDRKTATIFRFISACALTPVFLGTLAAIKANKPPFVLHTVQTAPFYILATIKRSGLILVPAVVSVC
uniref:Uncharacterized protein n=1 Tax=Anguilla anguilla TaxID=7936 RepID=A0A0E9SMS3_ANGAN